MGLNSLYVRGSTRVAVPGNTELSYRYMLGPRSDAVLYIALSTASSPQHVKLMNPNDFVVLRFFAPRTRVILQSFNWCFSCKKVVNLVSLYTQFVISYCCRRIKGYIGGL
jgi:hypothetical protein